MYDFAAMRWFYVSAAASGTAPTERYGHGFEAARGNLYVYGGHLGQNLFGKASFTCFNANESITT
jgi:hypothetical protein